jgi:hypothetical protein
LDGSTDRSVRFRATSDSISRLVAAAALGPRREARREGRAGPTWLLGGGVTGDPFRARPQSADDAAAYDS